ncbi:MAG TPA: hypothetical protein VM223_02615, partial [Planctomycetota bacterium]|nr:hypothetical protein [Planctomycetota bacterium]
PWIKPEVIPNQSGVRLVTLPGSTKTKALLISETRRWGRSRLDVLRIFSRRLHNVVPWALANAESEYTRYSSLSPPHTFAAADIVKGRGSWINTGKDKEGRILRPPTSDVYPSWFVLSWRDEKQITGMWSNDDFLACDYFYFIGPPNMNPTVGSDKDWKKLRVHGDRSGRTQSRGNRIQHWIEFDKPITTRGIKMLIMKTTEPQVSVIDGCHVLSDLGDAPVPKFQPPVADLAPFRVPYQVPFDGKVTMVVNKPDGTRAQNLVTLLERTKGESAEYWDLKDESGKFVEPGTYKWLAIEHRPLELRYEMTPYPNVADNSPENSAWLNGHSGPGGWMADHTPPDACCTAGDRVWLGSPCAESGVSTIECDLTGKKLWGHHSFAAWTGPQHMATDGKTVFVASSAWGTASDWNIDPTTELFWGIDIETHEITDVARLQPTNERKRGMKGLAARDGKLYAAIDADANYLGNAAMSGDVDIENCSPRYPRKPPPRKEHDVVPDGRTDFLRLFRLQGAPPGHNESVLTYLETTKGPARRQHIVLAFNKPVPIGSVAFPVPRGESEGVTGANGSRARVEKMQFKLSVLKADAAYPPDPEKASDWEPFEENGKNMWDVVPAPKNTLTRALRITFVKGEDDVFSEIEDIATTGAGVDNLTEADDKGGAEGDKRSWMAQLEGMKLLRRRLVNLLPTARIKVNSGKVDKDGVWDADRAKDRPLSSVDPAIYVMEWDKPQDVRGVAIMEIDGKRTEFDVYTGPDDQPINIESQENWKQAGSWEQPLRNYYFPNENCNPNARYLDGYVDFGPDIKTRAVRLRVVEQWTTKQHYPSGVRSDRGGQDLDATRCHVWGIAPVQYIGGESPVDPLIAERLEVIDTKGKLQSEVHIKKVGRIAFHKPSGDLYAVSDGRIVKVDLKEGKHTPLITDLKRPTALCVDDARNIYVFDGDGERRVIRVYDQTGKYLRDIGLPGGYKPGPWDGQNFMNVTALDIDVQKQLWAVDSHYWPKRVSLWSLDGKLKKEFLGPTQYGGGGVLDPYDKTRLFYGPLEFELNWEKGTTRLKNYTWTGSSRAAEVPIRINNREYMVTRPHEGCNAEQPCGIVYLWEKDHLKLAAAMGIANGFPPLEKPEVREVMGGRGLNELGFIWCDRNGDGDVQPDEVTFKDVKNRAPGVGFFSRKDLGLQASSTRYEVKEFLPNGVPVYEEKEYPLQGRYQFRLDNGTFFHLADMGPRDMLNSCFTPEGKMLWSYATEGSSGHALARAKPMYPSQVVSEFAWIGHETAHAGDLGEFVVIHSNVGTWNVWTSDGLLAARIFRDIRDPKAVAWSMREHQRGLRLEEVTPGQEHFQGYFCRSLADNKYYVVAGHNHASVVEVSGIDKFKRVSGEITVTPDDIRKASEWDLEQQQKAAYTRACVIDCFPSKREVRIDGSPDDWEAATAAVASAALFADAPDTPVDDAKLNVTFDDKYLYLCFDTRGMGPMRNSGEQWDRMFKTGASV